MVTDQFSHAERELKSMQLPARRPRSPLRSQIRPLQSRSFYQEATLRSRKPTATSPCRPISRPCQAGKSDIGHSLDALILRNVPNVRKAMDEWAYRRGIRLSFIHPGKPVGNAFAESCDGRTTGRMPTPPTECPVSIRSPVHSLSSRSSCPLEVADSQQSIVQADSDV